MFGIFDEGQHRIIDQVGGGLGAGDQQQLEEAHDLLVGEALAIHFRLHQPRQQIFARLGTPPAELLRKIGGHLRPDSEYSALAVELASPPGTV